MTSLEQRPSLEDRIRAATRAAASIVPDDGAPPLQLRTQQRRPNRLPTGFRHIRTSPRIWPGPPWLLRLAAPLAATAAVAAVIAASLAVADRSHFPAPSARGLAGAPPYYLELASAYTTGAMATVTATSTVPATASSPATAGQLVSPRATGPATTSSPATTGQVASPPTTGQLVSPAATEPATTTSPGPDGHSTTVGLRTTSLAASFGMRAVIRDTLTGATIATIQPPPPFDTFVMATAAADDRTFVLAAQKVSGSSLFPCGPTRLFLARFNPADRHVALTSLPVREFPASIQLGAIALSPDGTRLAVALEPGQRCSSDSLPLERPGNHAAGRDEVSVYSLRSGAFEDWPGSPAWIAAGLADRSALSWATDGTLAFTFPASHRDGFGPGVDRLNTNTITASGSLRSLLGSVLGPEFQLPSGWLYAGHGLLTADGKTVVVPIQRTPQHAGNTGAAFGEFSASTGKLLRVLWPEQVSYLPGLVPYYSVVWTNSSGSVLVVAAPERRGGKAGTQSVYGVLRGHRFTPIPGAPRPDALTLFSDTVIVF